MATLPPVTGAVLDALGEGGISLRVRPMPATAATTELDTSHTLPEDAAERFEQQGFIRLSGVLSPETIAAYEPEITSKIRELNTQHVPLAERDTYGKAFLQVSNVWRHSERIREMVFSQRLARIAAELMGVEAVRLYEDQALYKEPSGGITQWHADPYYWPLVSDCICTVWIPLQEMPLEMGPLVFVAGSHTFSCGRDMEIGDTGEAALQQAR
ncbi:hypothetical protein GCM10022206_02180 [Streptomyces chiangmaiensis]